MTTITKLSDPLPRPARPVRSVARVNIHWARVQAWSGLAFAAFTTVHLVNTALAALSPTAYNVFQRAVRPVYQSPMVEILLVLGPLLVHMLAGVMRMRARRRSASPNLRVQMHRYSGYFLLAVIIGHVVATRGPVWVHSAYPEFEGVAFSFQFMPFWFYPYYTALALAGVVHLIVGVPLAVSIVGPRIPLAWRTGPALWVPLLGVGGLVLLGIAGLGGLLYTIPDASGHPFARVVVDLTDRFLGG